jgi:acetyltransferase-like isoleucine patch superfamily enzyme
MVKSWKNNKKLSSFLFGAYTYFEKSIYSLINLFPKSIRKIYYKIFFAEFGKNVFIDEGCYFRYPWKISIGDNVVINRGCEFYPSMKVFGAGISVKENVILAPNVVLFGAGQDPRNPSEIDVAEGISINRNSYIGGNSVIRYGVQIGEFATVGAGSVVVKNVKAKTVVAGNPATLIRNL